MSRTYQFVTDCRSSDNESISSLKGSEEEISLGQFRRRIGMPQWKQLQAELGYDRDFPISGDWHIGYYRGIYQGQPAVFLRWSGIEFIFVSPSPWTWRIPFHPSQWEEWW